MATPRSWLTSANDSPFGAHNLPYGVFTAADRPGRRRIGVRIGDFVLDAGAAARTVGESSDLLDAETLNPLMGAGRPIWTEVRAALTRWLTEETHRDALTPLLLPLADVELHLPFEVADYVDFYASEHHAANLGRILRPGSEPLTPNWKHVPIGYHGRSGTIVVSGTPVMRPHGQRKTPADASPSFGPTRRLDIEAEVGFVVGTPSRLGTPVPQDRFHEHVFGVCLVNDWSARDIQPWEYIPLGPFLSKSFTTSLSPWIVPLEALEGARITPPARDVEPLPYLDDRQREPWGLDLAMEVRLNGHLISRPPFGAMYWTAAQQLAHMTVNGASLRTGDFFASGTVSGPEPDTRGALIELTWNGEEPLKLPDGTTRTFLEDGDEVTITATAPGPNGTTVGFGEVTGRIAP
ncbi:fumarylacetoacetase [Streptomyces sp. NPDC058877]|uniref:fumarylacetoacetase n=1 Tax=Streptomyces sp. NPDC058877 TaxID=3346665 RepID=UPI0036A9178A